MLVCLGNRIMLVCFQFKITERVGSYCTFETFWEAQGIHIHEAAIWFSCQNRWECFLKIPSSCLLHWKVRGCDSLRLKIEVFRFQQIFWCYWRKLIINVNTHDRKVWLLWSISSLFSVSIVLFLLFHVITLAQQHCLRFGFLFFILSAGVVHRSNTWQLTSLHFCLSWSLRLGQPTCINLWSNSSCKSSLTGLLSSIMEKRKCQYEWY